MKHIYHIAFCPFVEITVITVVAFGNIPFVKRFNHHQYEERLQLLVFLVEIAKSDGHVCNEEIEALKEVAMYMGLSVKEVESMLNLGGSSLNEAYKVLELEPTATNDEVRAAYRRLALKHHPDRVATLGEDCRRTSAD